MERYLCEKGVPKERVLREDKSVNTYQNMQFSKNVIEKNCGDYYCPVFLAYMIEHPSKKNVLREILLLYFICWIFVGRCIVKYNKFFMFYDNYVTFQMIIYC